MRYFDFHRRRLAFKDHISATPSTVSGAESVMLNATSGSKISALEIAGNTHQETEESSPIVEQAISSGDFTSTGENYIAYYITSDRLTALQEWATDKGYTGNFNLSVSVENTSEVPTGFAVVAGSSLDDILTGNNTTLVYYKSPYTGESIDTVAVNSSETVYIGIGNTDDGVGEGASEYLDLFLSNFTFCLQPTEYKGIPSPENPSCVNNSNSSGSNIVLNGKNLIDYKAIKYKGYAVPTLIENGFIVSGNYYASIEKVALLPNTDYNISFISDIISLGDGATVTIFPQSSTTEKIAIFNVAGGSTGGTFNTGNHTLFKIAFYSGYKIAGTVKFTNIQLELGKVATEYEPYFNKTVLIPSSVTLSDGTSLSINLAKVGDKADKLSVKGPRAIYSQSTEKITLTGEESGWGEADGVYKYSFDKPLIENVGYCTHFKLSTMGEENTFGVESDGITFKTDASDSLESFKAWLKAKSDAGNAVQVTVALASPAEYDVTKTDFAKELLNLETSRGYNLTLEAKADIAPSTLSCEYYSLENEDKQTVAVRCEKADGTSLCEPILHEVRKNTLYTVKAPEIDGYVSDKESESADASLATEIKFTYTEAEK